MVKFYLLVLSILVGLIIIYKVTFSENELRSTELEFDFSFPILSEEVHLINPVSFTFSKDYIFVSDQQASTIYQFDYQGKFFNKIGEKGSGPGEFLIPGHIKYYEDNLFVNDIGNGRFTTINLISNQVESYFPKLIPLEFDLLDNKIFMTHFIKGQKENIEQLPLIWNYDFELNLNNTMGNYLSDIVDNVTPDASESYLIAHNDHLYVLFTYYPILKIYSTDNGELIHSIDFDKYYRKMIQQNYQEITFADPSYINLRTLFSAFDTNEAGLFFCVFNENAIIIDHFDHGGRFQKRFRRQLNNDSTYYVRAMEVIIRNESGLEFYLLNIEDGLPKIDVYKWYKN